MTATKVITRLLWWHPIVFSQLPLTPARCILSTRVGIDVLSRFGVTAVPRSVICVVTNEAYERFRQKAEATPEAERISLIPPAGAWSVWAGLPPEAGTHDPDRSWAGHLAMWVPSQEALIDLDFQAFDRPARGISVPPVFTAPWPSDVPAISYGLSTRALFVHYETHDANDGYLKAIDWRSDIGCTVAIVDVIERAIRKHDHGTALAGAIAELAELARIERQLRDQRARLTKTATIQ